MRKILLFSILAVAILVFAGCSKKAVDSDNSANVMSDVAVQEVVIEEGLYVVDIAESTMSWFGDKYTGSAHAGMVNLQSGELEIINNSIVGGQFVIDMTTITDDDGSESLENHLKGEDFFATNTYPESVLDIKSSKLLRVNQEDLPVFEVVADLTIKGITNEIVFESIVDVFRGELKAYSKLNLDRTAWGVNYGSGKFFENLKDNAIKDEMIFDIMVVGEIK